MPSPPRPSQPACGDKPEEKCKQDKCGNYKPQKKENCKKTCGLCDPLPPPLLPPSAPPPENNCAGLADKKKCKITKMVKKCKKKPPKSMKKCQKKCKQDAKAKRLCEQTCCELGF